MRFKLRENNNSCIIKESHLDSLISDYENRIPFEKETRLRSDYKVRMFSGSFKVDTIYIEYDRAYNRYPRLIGYAHNDRGEYDHDYLKASDILNADLYDYMKGEDIVDFASMINDNPEIFY